MACACCCSTGHARRRSGSGARYLRSCLTTAAARRARSTASRISFGIGRRPEAAATNERGLAARFPFLGRRTLEAPVFIFVSSVLSSMLARQATECKDLADPQPCAEGVRPKKVHAPSLAPRER